ncbi:MAG: hypothetical protein IH621_16195 [Krumholzibacteria bacterium]|nr:hypothetical protein [Candidatus Krumholzibacteria bacterium]
MRRPAPASLRDLWPATLPLLPILFAYGQVVGFGFVNFDDDMYVDANPRVLGGPTGANLRWALFTGYQGVWIPATWVSLQLEAALFGTGPAGFHRTNLILHLVNALCWCTPWCWCSAAAAGGPWPWPRSSPRTP